MSTPAQAYGKPHLFKCGRIWLCYAKRLPIAGVGATMTEAYADMKGRWLGYLAFKRAGYPIKMRWD